MTRDGSLHLLIVQSGPLTQLPFQVLVTKLSIGPLAAGGCQPSRSVPSFCSAGLRIAFAAASARDRRNQPGWAGLYRSIARDRSPFEREHLRTP